MSPETGVPFGFRHRELAGYANGYPVLLVNKLGAARAADALQYLMDGNYLDGWGGGRRGAGGAWLISVAPAGRPCGSLRARPS